MLISTHQPCPSCGSSDALSIYDDHTYCFSCGITERANDSFAAEEGAAEQGDGYRHKNKKIKPLTTKMIDGTIGTYLPKVSSSLKDHHISHTNNLVDNNNLYEDLVFNYDDVIIYDDVLSKSTLGTDNQSKGNRLYRSLTKETLDHYKTVMTDKNITFYYDDNSRKIRSLQDKKFWSEGEISKAPLFGQNLDQGRWLTITEGEIDAMSCYQMMGSKYPCISVRSASQAKKDCEAQFKYLNSFERIYLCFDSDEPGQKAVKDVASLFNPNKVYHVIMNHHKDANDYLTNNHQDLFMKEWWNARPYLPSGIVGDYQSIEEILLTESNAPIATYPFHKLQEMTYGIRSAEFILFTAQEKVGKGLTLTTILPTPTGWTTVANLKIGDSLLSIDGTVVNVSYITEIQTRPCYRFTFSDTTILDVDDVHRWTVRDLQGRVHVKNTMELLEVPTIMPGSKASWMVPQIKAVNLPKANVQIDPFLLGIWLADGNSHSCNIYLSKNKIDRASMSEITKTTQIGGDCYSVRFKELTLDQLREYNLLKNKHIPSIYMRASLEQRQELFKGLCFDGWQGNKDKQQNEYYSSNKELFDQVVELARSLGYIVTTRQRQGRYKKDGVWINCKTAYSFRYRTAEWKAIRSIEYIGPMEGRCLTVDHPEHLFAAGPGWTMTHNTEIMRAIEYHLLKTTDYNIGIIHLEEEEKRTIQGLATYELKKPVHLHDYGVSNKETLDAYRKVTKKDNRCFLYKHFGSDDPQVILDTIRYLVVACHCKFIFLDHITMLVTGFASDDERKTLDHLSTHLAMMTRELDFTLFVVSHVNDDGKTRGSRNISKVADLIVFLNRDIEAEMEEERNKTTLMIKGNRFSGLSGPSSVLMFNTDTFTYEDEGLKFKDDTEAIRSQQSSSSKVQSSNSGAETLWLQASSEERQ